MNQLKQTFKPEFLNRLDEIIIFHSLNKTNMITIVDIQLSQVIKRLAQQGYSLVILAKAKQALAERGYNDEYGARPLKRLIEKEIVNPLAQLILEKGNKNVQHKIAVDYSHGKFKIN